MVLVPCLPLKRRHVAHVGVPGTAHTVDGGLNLRDAAPRFADTTRHLLDAIVLG